MYFYLVFSINQLDFNWYLNVSQKNGLDKFYVKNVGLSDFLVKYSKIVVAP